MAGSQKSRKYAMTYNGAGKRQAAIGTAMAQSALDTRHPMSSPIVPAKVVSRDTKLDCSGEYIIGSQVTTQFYRYTISFDPTAKLLAMWLAFAYGAAAAPTGSPANEVQTLTSDKTAGTFTLGFDFEGISETTPALPFNVTAAALQTALENLRSIKPGNVTVTGTIGAGLVITFIGRLAKANVPLLVLTSSLTGGTAAAVVQTTPGANKLHAISRTASDQHPVTTLLFGFEGDTEDPDKFKDVTVDGIRIKGAAGKTGKVTVEVDVISSADLSDLVSAYTFPACVNADPIYTKDCRLEIDGSFMTERLREFTFSYSNSINTGDDAFPFDDIDLQSTEHGDRRSSFVFTILGSKGDTEYDLADSESTVPVNLYIGAPGDRIKIIAPETNLVLADTPLVFVGDVNKSAYVINGTPYFSATVGTPDSIEASLAYTGTFLST